MYRKPSGSPAVLYRRAYKFRDLVTLIARHYDSQPATCYGREHRPL